MLAYQCQHHRPNISFSWQGDNVPFVVAVGGADAPPAGLAEPHALGGAGAHGSLHGICARRGGRVEGRLDEGRDGGAHAAFAQATMPIALGDRRRRFDGAVLYQASVSFTTPICIPFPTDDPGPQRQNQTNTREAKAKARSSTAPLTLQTTSPHLLHWPTMSRAQSPALPL